MRYPSHWKTIAAMTAVLAGVVSATSYGRAEALGTSIVAELQSPELLKTLFVRRAGDARAALREAGIGYKVVKPVPNGVAGEIADGASTDKAREILEAVARGEPAFALERSGLKFTLKLPESVIAALIDQAAGQALIVLQRRLRDLKLAGASVERQDHDRFLIRLPKSVDPQEVGKVIGQTGLLTFQAACDEQPGGQVSNPPENCAAYPLKNIPDEKMWVKTAGAAIVDGNDINDASASLDSGTHQPVVNFRFSRKGAERFGQLTSDNIGRPIAIILDKVVLSAPRIVEPILGGNGQISGSFTVADANGLALVLRSGALPAPISYVSMKQEP